MGSYGWGLGVKKAGGVGVCRGVGLEGVSWFVGQGARDVGWRK